MKVDFTKAFFKITITGGLLLTGAILSCIFSPTASAFGLGNNGDITIYQNAADNPEGESDIGRYFWVNFNGLVDFNNNAGPQALQGLTSRALFRVSRFETLNNKTTVELSTQLFAGIDDAGNPLPFTDRFEDYRVSVLGFAVDPNATNASVNGVFNTVAFNQINANGGIDTEICFKDGQANNCNGGTNGGVQLGQKGHFTISFELASPSDRFTLSNFGIRYQSIASRFYGLQDGSGTGIGEPVPEPLTILGTGMALGFGGLFQREFSKKQKKKIKA